MYIIETINKNVVACISTFDISLENEIFNTKISMALADYYGTKDIDLEKGKLFSTENDELFLEEVRVDNKNYDFLIKKIKIY